MKINRVGSCNYRGETHLPETSPSLLLPRLLLRAAALQFRVIYLRRSFNHRAVTQAERKSFGGKGGRERGRTEREERRTESGICDKDRKEWERKRTAAAVRETDKKKETEKKEKFKEARWRK